MNLADPELELIDPTPNVHSLFLQFDSMFFWAKLASRAVVRWSKRMYSCAGICSYEGRGGLCDIALSEPLLKLRPRKDLVQTLLHEMIHAYLFVTCRDQDRDGHGPNFKAHMHRINRTAGLNISIYHDFHDEVREYQTHVWRCNGPCQKTRPHFGIVRRTANRAPCERDFWWADHKRRCAGTFVKIKEPEVSGNKKINVKDKPKADITKYVSIKINNPQVPNPVLKDSNTLPAKTKSSGSETLVITKKGPLLNPKATQPPLLFNGKREILTSNRPRSNSVGVAETVRNIWATRNISSISPTSPNPSSALETVRNIWANKQIPVTPMAASTQNLQQDKALNSEITSKNKQIMNKHKTDSHVDRPPAKIKKIDDYFKATASTILKDLYGQDIKISHTTTKDQKIIAVNVSKVEVVNSPSSSKHVACPVCSTNINNSDINRHLDECLNKEIIDNLTKGTSPLQTTAATHSNHLKNLYRNIQPIPAFVTKTEETDNEINEKLRTKAIMKQHPDIQEISRETGDIKVSYRSTFDTPNGFDPVDVNKVKTIMKKINYDKNIKQSSNYIVPKEEENNVDFGYLPSFLDDEACKIENPIVKIESVADINRQKCACCGNKLDKPLGDHLDECLAFFGNNNTIPNEGASTSFANETIVIDDDDDIFDETQTFNATGTKTPCPCCLQMIEETAMNDHLDRCLSGDFQGDL